MRALCLLTALLPAMLPGAGPVDGASTGLPGARLVPAARWPTPLRLSRAVDQDGFPVLENPGFEALRADGLYPEWWLRVWLPQGAPSAAQGERAFRCSGSEYLYTPYLPPESPFQHVTFAGRIHGDSGEERGLVQMEQTSPGAGFLTASSAASASGFGTVRATFSVFGGAPSNRFFIQSTNGRLWVDWDEVSLLRENFKSPEFDRAGEPSSTAGWVASAGASIGDGSAALAPGAFIEQEVAASADGQTQFIRVLGAGAAIEVEQSFLARDGTELTSETLTLPGGLATGAIPAGAASARVRVVNAGGKGAVIQSADRGFVFAFPRTFHPDPSADWPAMTFAAAWPGRLASATVAIRRGESTLTTLGLEGDPNTASTTWDGGFATSGDYIARFVLSGLDGTSMAFDEPFRIERNVLFRPDPAFPPQDDFALGAWLWILRDGAGVEDLRPLFESAAGDGFNQCVVFMRPDQQPAVRELCEELAFPFYAAGPVIEAPIRIPPRFDELEYEGYRAAIAAATVAVRDSPVYRGIYAIDEPEPRFLMPRTGRAMRILDSDGTLGVGIFAMQPTFASAANWEKADPFIHMAFNYPFEMVQPDDGAALAAYRDFSAQQNAFATARGRAYWAIPQAFSNPRSFRPPSAAATRAMIGLDLANGTRGFYPFFYRAIGDLEGMRGFDLELFPRGEEWMRENARIAAASSLLMRLRSHAPVAAVSGAIHATVARDAEEPDASYCFVVSLDTAVETTATLELAVGAATLSDAETGESLEVVSGRAIVRLEPGGWRLLRASEGAIASVAAAMPPASPVEAPPFRTVATIQGSRRPVLAIDFNDHGSLALVSQGDGARVVAVCTEGAPIVQTVPAAIGGKAVFVQGSLALMPDAGRGINEGEFSTEEQPSYMVDRGQPGNADEIGGNYARAFATCDFLGVRVLERDGLGALRTVARVGIDDVLDDIAVPSDAGSALVAADFGLWRVSGAWSAEKVWDDRRLWRAALSPGGTRLAVAQLERGFSVHELGTDSSVESSRLFEGMTTFATAVAWADDWTLLVADGTEGVRVIRQRPGGGAVELAVWRPFDSPAVISAVACEAGWVAAGDSTGRVVFAELAPVAPPLAADGWTLR